MSILLRYARRAARRSNIMSLLLETVEQTTSDPANMRVYASLACNVTRCLIDELACMQLIASAHGSGD
jgi:hypothetical protein